MSDNNGVHEVIEIGVGRSLEQLRKHYEVEKELAARLRQASKEERKCLYSILYDELYRRVPDHPQLTRKVTPEDTRKAIDEQMEFLGRFLAPDVTYMEIGAGDCRLAAEVAARVKQVYAIDVSAEVSNIGSPPDNFSLIISDGCSIPVPKESVDVAYSNQVMEHLHEDDVLEQLSNVFRAIKSGGIFICITPNRLSGPHDISKYFGSVASGFHLREYTTSELNRIFKGVGFSRVTAYARLRLRVMRLPVSLIKISEALLGALPRDRCRAVARALPFRRLIHTRVVAHK
jgi:SAM-dependent methyltransferase